MPSSSTSRAVSPRSRIFQRHGTALAFVLGGTLMLAPAASWALPIPAVLAQEETAGQVASGSEVIAQGVTRLPRGNVAWLINRDAVPGAEGAPVATFPLGFGLTDTGSVEVRDEDGGTLGVLDRGEGMFLPVGNGGSLVSRTADDADLFVILLISGEAAAGGSLPGTVVGEPFPVPESRDVEMELRRGVLRNDDEAVVPLAASRTPSLLLVTGGTAQIASADGEPVTLNAGQYALLASGVTVRSADGAPAEFVVAAIGDAVTASRGAGNDNQPRTRNRASNAGATSAGASSGGGGRSGGGGGGGGGGRAAGGSADQGAAPADDTTATDREQRRREREARRQAREERRSQNSSGDTPADGTPTPIETPQDTPPATPTPVTDDDTADQDDEDIVIVDQDDTEVDDTDEQDASDPGPTDDEPQVVETPVTEEPPADEIPTEPTEPTDPAESTDPVETTDPAENTEPEAPVDEAPVEEPIVEQPTGDEAPADEAPDADQAAPDPAVEQIDAAATLVEQVAPEDVIIDEAVPEEIIVEPASPEEVVEQIPADADPAAGDDATAP